MFLKELTRKYNHPLIAEGIREMREETMNSTHLTFHREHFRTPSQDDLRKERLRYVWNVWFV